jgi:hypothetical protein
VKEPAEVSPRTVTDNRLGRPKTFRETAETEHTRSYQGGLWLSFLNTVRTERFDQVLAIKALLSADRASRIPSMCWLCAQQRGGGGGGERHDSSDGKNSRSVEAVLEQMGKRARLERWIACPGRTNGGSKHL